MSVFDRLLALVADIEEAGRLDRPRVRIRATINGRTFTIGVWPL